MVVSIDGKIVDEKNACVPVTSDAFLFGFAVFETIRTYNKKIFRLDDHLARLYISADVIGLKPKWNFKQTYKAVADILGKSEYKEEKIRVILTKSSLIIIVEKLQEKPASFYAKGVKLVSYIGKRNTPRAKVLADSFTYLAKHHAENCGVYEALLVDPKKYYIRECAYANIFWVDGDKLYTTNKDILYGITRDTVAEIYGKCNFKGIKLKSLLNADEVFITQTTSGILPVVEIDGYKIGEGKPGPVTKKLMKEFNKLVRGK
jgi:branched-chain amino acid aminotransferase